MEWRILKNKSYQMNNQMMYLLYFLLGIAISFSCLIDSLCQHIPAHNV